MTPAALPIVRTGFNESAGASALTSGVGAGTEIARSLIAQQQMRNQIEQANAEIALREEAQAIEQQMQSQRLIAADRMQARELAQKTQAEREQNSTVLQKELMQNAPDSEKARKIAAFLAGVGSVKDYGDFTSFMVANNDFVSDKDVAPFASEFGRNLKNKAELDQALKKENEDQIKKSALGKANQAMTDRFAFLVEQYPNEAAKLTATLSQSGDITPATNKLMDQLNVRYRTEKIMSAPTATLQAMVAGAQAEYDAARKDYVDRLMEQDKAGVRKKGEEPLTREKVELMANSNTDLRKLRYKLINLQSELTTRASASGADAGGSGDVIYNRDADGKLVLAEPSLR